MSEIITTAAELDALPEGSVVLSCGDNALRKCDEYWTVADGSGDRWTSYGAVRVYAPLVVLYRPDQPQRTERPSFDAVRNAIFHSTYPNMRMVDLTDEEALDFNKAADAIIELLPGRSEAEIRAEVLAPVIAFINQRPEYINAMKNSQTDDADYYRWTGNAEARRQLATTLGVQVPYNYGDRIIQEGPHE